MWLICSRWQELRLRLCCLLLRPRKTMVMTAPVFDKYIQDDIAKWSKVIKSANIKAE